MLGIGATTRTRALLLRRHRPIPLERVRAYRSDRQVFPFRRFAPQQQEWTKRGGVTVANAIRLRGKHDVPWNDKDCTEGASVSLESDDLTQFLRSESATMEDLLQEGTVMCCPDDTVEDTQGFPLGMSGRRTWVGICPEVAALKTASLGPIAEYNAGGCGTDIGFNDIH